MKSSPGHIHLRDHLGNLRVSLTFDKEGKPLILQEHHYYPFGLRHKGYGLPPAQIRYDADRDKIFTVQNVAGRYKYWYQEQERQTDLDLNWDSFKYRNHDYAIGRFMSMDPLAEKYPYNSTYAFQENKLGSGRELEGLELGLFLGLNYFMGVSDVLLVDNGKYIEITTRVGKSSVEIENAKPIPNSNLTRISRLAENTNRGRQVESEQLAKEGLTKNTQKFTRVDPKTGKEGTTIPDAIDKNGRTVEIKNVKNNH